MVILQPFTNTVHELEQAIRRTSAGGSTSMYNAIYIALKDLKRIVAKNVDEIRRQSIIVLSDGEDTSSLLPFDEVLDLAKRSETAIYAIGLGSIEGSSSSGRGFKEAEFVLRQLSQETGGRAFFPSQLGDLANVYGQISDELSSQYTVGYTSRNARHERRVAPDRGARQPAEPHRANQTGLFRADGQMNVVPLALYVVALAAYIWHFARRDPLVGRSATTLLVAAVLAHTFLIGMKTMEVGHLPMGGATSAISTFVLLLAVAYLCIEVTTDERAMGAFILPLLAALQAIPAFRPGLEERAAVLQGPLFGLHVSSLLFAYASFALACVIGITYVLLFKEIKAKHLGFFYARLPSLQVLDSMNQRAIIFGWVFLTIGIARGCDLDLAGARLRARRPARAEHVAPGSQDLRRAGVLGRVLLRVVRGATHRVGRTAGGVSVGARLCDRAAELRADQLFPDEKSRFLTLESRYLVIGYLVIGYLVISMNNQATQ